MEKEETLLSGDIKKTYVSYLIPTIVGMLTNSVYCIVDVMFVGLCIGAQGLAAFNIAMPVYTIYSSLGLMLGVGGADLLYFVCIYGGEYSSDVLLSIGGKY